MVTLNIRTEKRCALVDITRQVREAVRTSGAASGAAFVYSPHTTCGVTINENADPDVVRDVLFALDRMAPNQGFYHSEGNSDAHTKAALVGFSQMIPVENGNLVLGTWQSVYLAEFDGPHVRKVHVQVLRG